MRIPRRLVLSEDQLQTPGRPVVDKAFLDDAGILRWKDRCLFTRGQISYLVEMSRGLRPPLFPSVEMIVDQQKSSGVGKIGIPARLVL